MVIKNFGGSDFAASPHMGWKFNGEDSAASRRGASARKLAASMWQCSRQFDRMGLKFCSSLRPIPKFAMEGVTKWDKLNQNQDVVSVSIASDRQAESLIGRKRIKELERDREWSTTKIECYMKKLIEERTQRASCARTEHNKTYAKLKELKDGVERERRNVKKMELLSKLLDDIAEAKLSARRLMKSFEKEKKAKESLKDMYCAFAKEIEAEKTEIEALRNRCKRIQVEVEEERKMSRITEAWRETRAQVKLTDAMFVLEDKYSRMNNLIAGVEAVLRQTNLNTDANTVPNSVNSFSLIKDFRGSDQMQDGSCFHYINVEAENSTRKSVPSNGLICGSSGFKDAKWKNSARNESHKFKSSSSITRHSRKKGSNACQLKRILQRDGYTSKTIVIDGSGSLSNKSTSSFISRISPQRVSNEGALHRCDLVSRRHSLEPINPHIVRAMKDHIEWPRGSQKHGSTTSIFKAVAYST